MVIKESVYNRETKINDDYLMYNTFTRKYMKYNQATRLGLKKLMSTLDKGEFTVQEFQVIKNLIERGFLVNDNIDEVNNIKHIEGKVKLSKGLYYLVLQPTLDCNFRCPYCYEKHKSVSMNEEVAQNVVSLIDNVSKENERLLIGWFGGEPLLEKNLILRLSKKIRQTCDKNQCRYQCSMTTNGYLLDEEFIEHIDEIGLKHIQVTLDGNKEYHNKMRPLINGEGTYEVIEKNLKKLIKKDIFLTLRINVKEYNYEHIGEIFDIIPQDERHKVQINLCNVFQEDTKLSMFNIYMEALNKGYKVGVFTNRFKTCEANINKTIVVDPEGMCAPCSVAAENNFYYGKLNKEGTIDFINKDGFDEFNGFSPCNTENCSKCNQLAMCMGGCKYSKFLNPKICNGKLPDGLSLDEKILLHYYSDVKNKKPIYEAVL